MPNIVYRLAVADGNAVISYGVDKQVSEMWNGVVGLQFQLYKHWQFQLKGDLMVVTENHS